MRNSLNIDDFEDFLEQEVNQHRMYPSDHVWRNIQHDLHGYKKWPALTIITLFVISALVAGTLLLKPNRLTNENAQANVNKTVSETILAGKLETPKENLQQHLSPEHITEQTILAVAADLDIKGAMQDAFAAYHGVTELPQGGDGNQSLAINNATYQPEVSSITVNNNNVAPVNNYNTSKPDATVLQYVAGGENIKGSRLHTSFWSNNKLGFNWMKAVDIDSLSPDRFYYRKGVWKAVYDGSILFFSADRIPSSTSSESIFYNLAEPNFIQKAAVSNYKLQPKRKRFDVRYYITPSLSSRTLTRNGSKTNAYLPGPPPSGAGYMVDVNALARTKTVPGYEAGASVGYKLSSFLTLRAGVQFNVRQYDVQGATANPGNSIVSNGISVVNNNGFAGGGDLSLQSAQTVSTTKSQPNVIVTNMYYQIALPVGVDWQAWGHGKFGWNIASAVQPTYILNKNPFIITTANRNYTEGAALMRKWNINANLETYFSYTMGKLKWQIGPQVRYQVLSSLKGNYPVSEHLLDYGIKIGLVKSLP